MMSALFLWRYWREQTVRLVAFLPRWRFAAELCLSGEGHEKVGVGRVSR